MVRPVLQGEKPTCGQCCVAMVAEVPLDRAIEACGRKGATFKEDLVRGLEKLGFAAGDTVRVKKGKLPTDITAIVKLNFPKRRRGHWVVLDHGMIYDSDSESGGPFLAHQYLELTSPSTGLKPTSFFEVKKA